MNVRRYKACQTITYRNGFKKILADYKGQVEFDETKIPVFDMIEENLQISTSEIATRLGVGVRTVKRRIKQMTNMVYVANGYSGHWEIKYFLRQQYDFGLTVQ